MSGSLRWRKVVGDPSLAWVKANKGLLRRNLVLVDTFISKEDAEIEGRNLQADGLTVEILPIFDSTERDPEIFYEVWAKQVKRKRQVVSGYIFNEELGKLVKV